LEFSHKEKAWYWQESKKKMNYIIIFDNTQLQFNLQEMHRFITTSPQVNDWWHYLPNVYIVDTRMTAKRMADSMRSYFIGLRFYITKLDLSDYNGVLAESAWEWMKRKTRQTFSLNRVPAPPPLNLVDLLKGIPTKPSQRKNDLLTALETTAINKK